MAIPEKAPESLCLTARERDKKEEERTMEAEKKSHTRMT